MNKPNNIGTYVVLNTCDMAIRVFRLAKRYVTQVLAISLKEQTIVY